MNTRDLTYLIALADHCHFGQAAAACFVSQPALSMQIKKLEETLGVKLIERTNKSFLLTKIGKIITEQAREILQQIETLRKTAANAKDLFAGDFNLGTIPTLAPYLLPHIIPELSKSFPRLTTYLIEQQTPKLITELQSGKLDAALLALPILQGNFFTLPLFEEEFLLAVSPRHPFAKRKFIQQSELSNKALLLLEEGHCMRDQALALCHQSNAKEVKSFQATSLETLRHMVASHVGITLMPKLACRSNDDVCYLPFRSPKPMRTIGIVCRVQHPKMQLIESLGHQIKRVLANQSAVKINRTKSTS